MWDTRVQTALRRAGRSPRLHTLFGPVSLSRPDGDKMHGSLPHMHMIQRMESWERVSQSKQCFCRSSSYYEPHLHGTVEMVFPPVRWFIFLVLRWFIVMPHGGDGVDLAL